MKSKTIGELLEFERKTRDVSLLELSAQTQISVDKLQALESNQFTNLPASPFVKGYLRSCARVLGLDSQALIAVLRRDYKESQVGKLVPRDNSQHRRTHFWHGRFLGWQGWVLGAVILAILVYVGVQWYQVTRPPELKLSQPVDQEVVAAEVVVSGYTQPASILLVNETPVALNPDGFFQTTLKFSEEGLALIKVEAIDEALRSTVLERTVFVEF